jgi:glycosyltransferase involved in cell wall biosynthesis
MPDVNSLKIKNFRTIDQSKTINYSDRVFVSALALSNQIEEKSKPFTVIHSGHDFHARFNFKKSNSEKKILCFMGFINNNLELDWIELLAKNNKYEIKFIGPVEHNSVKKRLSIYNNIYFEDSRTGINLQNFLNDSDVFIMPYKSIEVNTVSSVPAKLFQYLACGRPIISNILPNLISLPEYFVYQAKTSIDFLNLVELAINEDCEKYNMERINFANENKWEARGQLLQSVIVDDLSKFV